MEDSLEINEQNAPFMQNKKTKYFIGLILLLAVVALWTGANYTMKFVFADSEFMKPFMLTYINTSSFTLYLLIRVIGQLIQKVHRLLYDDHGARYQQMMESPDQFGSGDNLQVTLGVRDTMKLSLQFCILWFLANFCSNAALIYTNVASSTIISSTSSVWTLIIGSLGRTEKFTYVNLLGVLICFAGVLCVSLSDASAPSSGHNDGGDHIPDAAAAVDGGPVQTNDWRGNILALLGAMFYGLYITLLRLKIKDDVKVEMTLFFGLVGLFNIICLWPLFIVFHYSGFEQFQLPPTSTIWLALCLNALLGTCLSELLWLKSMLYTSPLVSTLGLSLTIPVALLIDTFLKDISLSALYLVGGLMVVGGFVLVNIFKFKPSFGSQIIQFLRDLYLRATKSLMSGRIRNDTSSNSLDDDLHQLSPQSSQQKILKVKY
ncbi:hypothetical protein MP228_000012 [Amoeboaphelidium protococcarum]|nr:hypothetical protein MP228_000012 [Amoeboaphelidium protococcarum]